VQHHRQGGVPVQQGEPLGELPARGVPVVDRLAVRQREQPVVRRRAVLGHHGQPRDRVQPGHDIDRRGGDVDRRRGVRGRAHGAEQRREGEQAA
jgi:hypothetical protein